MTNGLSVNDITPLGERPADVWRGRTGVLGAGVFTIAGSAISGTPTDGQLLEYNAALDEWVPVDASSLGSVMWFNVKTYGAVGDGTTDDTAAINAAIAALNTATRGVLYFPAGAYKCTAALTAITATGYLLGDGFVGSVDGTTTYASKIICTSGTANFLTVGSGFSVEKIALANTAGSVTAGYGIGCTSAIFPHFTDVSVTGFWINFDLDGSGWKATRCYSRQSHKYGYRIQYAAVPDGGDWNMTDCEAVDGANSSDAAIYYASGGGGKITGLKINSNASGFNHGIDAHFPNGISTSDLEITNCSIENFRGDGIHIQTDAGGAFTHITIVGNQIAQDTSFNTTGNAISLTANTAGNLTGIVIVGNTVQPLGVGTSTGAALKMTKADRVIVAELLSGVPTGGYTSYLSQSGCTNIIDHTGGIAGGTTVTLDGNAAHYVDGTGALSTPSGGGLSGGTPALTLGTSNSAGAASTGIRTDATILVFDSTVGTALGTASAGSGAIASRVNHVHPNTATGVKWTTGTSMPGSPSTNDRITRTDINGGTDFFYDGTRWRSVQTFREDFGTGNTLAPDTVGTAWGRMTLWGTAFDLWIVNWDVSTYASATNNGTNFWTVTLQKFDSADTPTGLDNFTTSADTQNAWTMRRRAIGASVVAASYTGMRVIGAKTLSPGAIYFATAIEYQIIGT